VAMSAGLDEARGDHVVLMHADLQDPPELIPQMLAAARNGADVAFARRIGSDESAVKRAMAAVFFAMMQRLAQAPFHGQAGDFRLMSRRVVEQLKRMPERRRFVRGMVDWVGFTQVPIEYRRAGRVRGRGASYPELFRLGVEAMASFSDVPLNLATYLGLGTALVSGVVALVLMLLALVQALQPGSHVWLLIAVLFIGGVQLVSTGILGRYLGRVHEESLERPLYVVDRVVGRSRATDKRDGHRNSQ
jgi:polyisoprenyl-phosphate glycosyltransferase